MSGAPALRVEALEIDAPDGRRLLAVPRLDIASGAFACIGGPSGAGKSTLLLALAGLTEHASGRVLWNDEDVLAMAPRARAAFRRERIGLVFQDFLLFDESDALSNAALGGAWRGGRERRRVTARARELLAGLGLDPDDRRPVERFSGGERQRVAIARALATEPCVVLADEPTASLDRDAADELVRTLRALAASGERTLVIVSHDVAVRDAADRVVALADGRPVDITPA